MSKFDTLVNGYSKISESYTGRFDTRVPENAPALEDLINRRKAINALIQTNTPNIPAGVSNGSQGLNAAYKEVSDSIEALMAKDTQGYEFR